MGAAKVPFGWPVPSPPVPNNGTKGRTLGSPATIDGVTLSNGACFRRRGGGVTGAHDKRHGEGVAINGGVSGDGGSSL